MAILRCTKKLLTELKTPNGDVIQTPNELNSWHVNLFRVDRRKCVIFTHDRTLYSFLALGLTKPDFQHFKEIFRQGLFKNLMADGIPKKQIIKVLLDDLQNIEFARTNNRSVLGSMNDLVFQVKSQISVWGGYSNVDIDKVNHYINRIPMSAIEKVFSIYEMQAFLSHFEK